MSASNVPKELRERQQWLVWSLKRNPADPDKPKKVPHARVNAPDEWRSHVDVQRDAKRGSGSGVGFVFSADDPYVGIDLDGCRNPETGQIAQWARTIIKQLNSYTEVSQSGTGVHIIVRGKLPPNIRHTCPFPGTAGSKKAKLEVYDRVRYFVMTGDVYGERRTIKGRQKRLDALVAQYLSKPSTATSDAGKAPPPSATEPTSAKRNEGLPDDAILLAIRRAHERRYRKLFEVPVKKGEDDDSAVDWELAHVVIEQVGNDPERAERIMRRSKRAREKWDRGCGDTTWLGHTIAEAIAAGSSPLPGTSAKAPFTAQMMALIDAADIELFHGPDQRAFASVLVDTQGDVPAHRETHALTTSAFKQWLAHRTYEQLGKVPSGQHLVEVVNVLAHRASKGPEHATPIRVGEHDGAIYLDLGDASWQAVEVKPTGWRVIEQPPVRFQRPATLGALPVPERGGSLDEFWRFFNVPEADRPLLVAYLLGALYPTGPYVILDLVGRPGSAKTSAAEYLKKLVDPGEPLTRGQPRSEEDLMIAASRNQLVAFDNLQSLSEWLVDAFCRLATGAGIGKRQKYTDGDEYVLKAWRPVVLTSVNGVAARADLLDRSIVLALPPMTRAARAQKKQLDLAFEAARPRLLGVLLDAMVVGLRRLPRVSLGAETPRMADFAHWAVACEKALWPAGTFMKRYAANQKNRQRTALDACPFVPHLVQLVQEQHAWKGTLRELLVAIGERADLSRPGATREAAWPKTPRAFGPRLREVSDALRSQHNIVVEDGKSGTNYVRLRLAGRKDREGT